MIPLRQLWYDFEISHAVVFCFSRCGERFGAVLLFTAWCVNRAGHLCSLVGAGLENEEA